jgi:hypothetical protein
VKQDVLQINRQVEQQNGQHDLQPARQRNEVEDSPALVLRGQRDAGQTEREAKAHRQAIDR